VLPTNLRLRALQRRRGATVNARQWVTFQPERASRRCRIDVLTLPPCRLIAGTMQLAMMPPTQRDGELITDFSPHCAALGKAKVVWIRRLPPANETSLLRDQPEVLSVANPSRLRQRQGGLIDSCGAARAGRIALGHRIAVA
jgi:hypothetical protein